MLYNYVQYQIQCFAMDQVYLMCHIIHWDATSAAMGVCGLCQVGRSHGNTVTMTHQTGTMFDCGRYYLVSWPHTIG